MKVSYLGSKLLDLVYPPSLYCNCCGNIIDETRVYNLCDHCLEHMKWDAEPIKQIGNLHTFKCADYGIYERTLIFSLKYNGKKYIAQDIAHIMADRIDIENIEYDAIVPVPMFKEKEKKRGFNQTVVIGKYLGKITGKAVYSKALIRNRDTSPMRGLNPTERQINVENSFELNEKYDKILRNKKILMIDDFYTTGSTASECGKALQQLDPQCIYFLTFASKN